MGFERVSWISCNARGSRGAERNPGHSFFGVWGPVMSTEDLREMAWKAEEEGRETYVEYHDEYDIIEYIEIDGVETYNDSFIDEVKDQYWLEDSYKIADRYWRQ